MLCRRFPLSFSIRRSFSSVGNGWIQTQELFATETTGTVYILPFDQKSKDFLFAIRQQPAYWYHGSSGKPDTKDCKTTYQAGSNKKVAYTIYPSGFKLPDKKNPGKPILMGGNQATKMKLVNIAKNEFIEEAGIDLTGQLGSVWKFAKGKDQIFYVMFVKLNEQSLVNVQRAIANNILLDSRSEDGWFNKVVKPGATTFQNPPNLADNEISDTDISAVDENQFQGNPYADWFSEVVTWFRQKDLNQMVFEKI